MRRLHPRRQAQPRWTGRRTLLLALAAVLATACDGGGSGLAVSPVAASLRPGESVAFSVPQVAPAEVAWAVEQPCEGSITQAGVFTAAERPATGGTCRVVARHVRLPLRSGSALVTILLGEPVHGVAAPGGRQTGGGYEVQSVALEPVSGASTRDLSSGVESRAGFHPSANASP